VKRPETRLLTASEKLTVLQELEKDRKGKKSQALIAQLKAIYQE